MNRQLPSSGVTLGCAGILAIVGIAFLLTTFRFIPEGHVGVVTSFGRATGGIVYPGLNLTIPLVQGVQLVETRVQSMPFENIEAATQELQTVKLTGIVSYQLEEYRIVELYRELGLGYEDRLVSTSFQDYIKGVTRRYSAQTITGEAERDGIRNAVTERLNADLRAYGITIRSVFIGNISYSAEYEAAIEAKQKAQQQALQAEEVLKQKKTEAEQRVAEARGLSESEVIRAKGEAEANRERTAGISDPLIRYLTVQKWDGHLPLVQSGLGDLMLDVSSITQGKK